MTHEISMSNYTHPGLRIVLFSMLLAIMLKLRVWGLGLRA